MLIFTAQPMLFIFSIIIAETLITISIAIAGFSCSAAQVQAPLYYVTIMLFISCTANEWEGTAGPTLPGTGMQRVNGFQNHGKGMKASSQNLSDTCKAWICVEELQCYI